MKIISINQLTQKYRKSKTIINSISFSVSKGSIHGLIGGNGAGKTTVIKSIIGALPTSKHSIEIDKINGHHAKIAYMPEKSLFPIGMNAFSYVSYLGFLSGLSLKKSKEKTKALFNEYGIEHLLHKNPIKFSSGEKKKVMLMQMLINDADILILDEPSSNLDPLIQATLFSIIKKLNKEGKTILISSHNLLAIGDLVDEITILQKGNILFTGLTKDFCKKENLNKSYIDFMMKRKKERSIKHV